MSNTTFSNGLVSLESTNGTVCCVLVCDRCSGDKCANTTGLSASDCCEDTLFLNCSDTNSATCRLDDVLASLYHCFPSKSNGMVKLLFLWKGSDPCRCLQDWTSSFGVGVAAVCCLEWCEPLCAKCTFCLFCH